MDLMNDSKNQDDQDLTWILNPKKFEPSPPSYFRDEQSCLEDYLERRYVGPDSRTEQNGGIPRGDLEKAMQQLRQRHGPSSHWKKNPFHFTSAGLFVVYYFMTFIGFIVYLIFHFFWSVSVGYHRVKRFLQSEFDIGALRTLFRCKLTGIPTPTDNFDFTMYRARTYLWSQTVYTARQLAYYLFGWQVFEPITDNELQAMMLCTCVSRDLTIEKNKKTISGDFTALANLSLYAKRYIDMREWSLNVKTKEQTLTMRSSGHRQHEEYKRVSDSEPDWKAAKAHFQGFLGVWVPAVTHNWVHFHFQDIAANQTKGIVPSDAVLGRLLRTHLRFTPVLNVSGPSMTLLAPQGHQTWMTLYTPWKAPPVAQQQFQTNIAVDAIDHYIDWGSEEEKKLQNNPSKWSVDKAFPPEFVRQRLPRFGGSGDPGFEEDECKSWEDVGNSSHFYDPAIIGLLPYCDMLADYYEVCYAFVYRIFDCLEPDLLASWMRGAQAEFLPKLANENPCDVLATLIWTGGIVHGLDHIVHGMLQQACFLTTCKSFAETKKYSDVLCPPRWSRGQWQLCRSRVFSELFVKYRESDFGLNDSITYTPDKHGNPHLYEWATITACQGDDNGQLAETLNAATRRFRIELEMVNEQHRWMCDIFECHLPASTSF